MENKKQSEKTELIPEIYAAISLLFGANTDITTIVNELNNIGIYEINIQRPKFESSVCIDLAIVHNECFWELNDALTKMFSKVDNCLHELRKITMEYHGEIYIDVAFYQYGTYPALVICGKNMEKIHLLEANLSIDPL